MKIIINNDNDHNNNNDIYNNNSSARGKAGLRVSCTVTVKSCNY